MLGRGCFAPAGYMLLRGMCFISCTAVMPVCNRSLSRPTSFLAVALTDPDSNRYPNSQRPSVSSSMSRVSDEGMARLSLRTSGGR